MSNHMETLFYTIKLIDEATGGTKAIMNQIDQVQSHYKKGMAGIATGAAGVFGAGYTLQKILAPALEMDRTLGEVKSLDVTRSALDALENSALRFSMQYGESASDIVKDSYKLQSSIQGLQGTDLANISYSAGVLAKGTKADFDAINAYTGQMFNVFQDRVQAMGKSNFMAELVDKTALAVQLFNTDGGEMVEAMKNIGNMAERAKVPLEEQLAVLGLLQNTMQMGGRAGTAYAAFLNGLGKAESVLGLQLTDTAGRALPIVDVLQRITGKYGDLSTVAAQGDLQKAFGTTGMKTLLGLSSNIEMLEGNINQLLDPSQYGGKAAHMAKQIADPWEQTQHTVKAVAIVFGKVLNPALTPVLANVRGGAAALMRWMQIAPNLTRMVGGLTLGVLGLVMAFSAFAIIGGLSKMVMAGYYTVLAVGTGIQKAWTLAKWLGTASLTAFRGAALAAVIQIGIMNSAMGLSTAATWLFNAALWANPITWIIAAFIAFIAALALVVIHWDAIKATIMDSTPFKYLQELIGGSIALLNKIPGINIGVNAQGERAKINQAAGLSAGGDSTVAGGGLMTQISNATNNSGTHVEKIEVNTTGGVNGYSLADEFAMAVG